MLRIAVLGDKESIFGYAALGLDTYYTNHGEDDAALLKKLYRRARGQTDRTPQNAHFRQYA